MGLCVSRRGMHEASSERPRKEEQAAELKRSSSEMINPARLLLESPRISSDISDMGMLGLLFHKRYCCKSLDSPNNKPNSSGYQKLKAGAGDTLESPVIAGKEAESEGGKPGMVIQENVLFEEQRREEEADDGYPTFEPNSQAQQMARGKDEEGGTRVWQSAGEEFYSEWEDRLRGKDQLQQLHRAQESREIGVFGAEDYFKEKVEGEHKPEKHEQQQQQQQVHACSSSSASSSSAAAASLTSSSSSACSSSGSGMKWATLCAGASAVEVDEPPPATATAPAGNPKKNKSKPAKSEILHISKMFKLLASPSASPSSKSSFSHKHKKARTSENRQPHHQHQHQPEPEAHPAEASGEVKLGFGSPFPSSSNLAEVQSVEGDEPAAGAGEEHEEQKQAGEQNEVNEGNESDSSSDLFELDSVATSLSSARSSLSRLSSARSSVRKSTVDEQDMLHFISDSSKQPAAQRQPEPQPAPASSSEESSINTSSCSSSASFSSSAAAVSSFTSSSSSSTSSSSSSSANVALLIMKNRRHTSHTSHNRALPCLEPGPLLSILEESNKPATGQRRVSKQLDSWNSIAVQT